MASYHCSVKVGGKGQASGHAAYIAREVSYAERADYEDLEATGYGNLPSLAEHEPSQFWSAADRYERANGATYREIEIALPRELNPDQRQALVLDFIRQEIGARHAHQWAIHNPGAALAGGCTTAGILALSLLGWGAIWWQRHEIARFNADIALLQSRPPNWRSARPESS